MQLIPSLQESAGHQIADLKKVLTKDKRVNKILGAQPDIDSIDNKAEFLATLKFHVLNNRNVLEFVASRNDVNALSKSILKKLRELKLADFDQKALDQLHDFIKTLLREHGSVERLSLSNHARKELVDWANANGRYFNLSLGTQRELASIPDLKPTRPIVLYRGLLFNSYDLKERKRYDGQLDVGKGLKFLRSVRDGSRTVDLEWDRPSSWTTSLETAKQFAKYSAQSSNYAATMNWLSRKGAIDGDLGFVISTLADPDDVLIDMSRFNTRAHLQHGNEGEVILKPGTYLARVHTKFTKQGEVDPVEAEVADDDIQDLENAVKEFLASWQVPSVSSKHDSWNFFRRATADEIFEMGKTSLKADLISSADQLRQFYLDKLAKIDYEQLLVASAKGKTQLLDALSDLSKSMKEERRHKDFKSPKNAYGTAPRFEMTGAQYRDTFNSSEANSLKVAEAGGRFTDRSAGEILSQLHNALTGKPAPDLHRKSGKDQAAAIEAIAKAITTRTGEAPLTDRKDQVAKIRTVLLAVDRNASVLATLRFTQDRLNKALAGQAE